MFGALNLLGSKNFQNKIFRLKFFGPKLFLGLKFFKSFQAEHFRLKLMLLLFLLGPKNLQYGDFLALKLTKQATESS